MAELEMMVEATERTAELETALLESQGRHLEAMAKIADAEARIALLEETAGIRDDVLAAMQDELDNLPIFVSAAQKDAFRLKEPGDAKIVASLYIDLCNCLILICSIQHQMKVNLWTKNSYRLWLTNWPKTSKPLKTSVSLIGC